MSFAEQFKTPQGNAAWKIDPQLNTPRGNAVWQYTPQSLAEGWLRYNPTILDFTFNNADNQPIVIAGQSNTLTLKVRNDKPADIAFTPGTIVGETDPNKTGSVFYIHFGRLVDSANVASMNFTAPGWTFTALTDATYGTYWGATPTTYPVTLKPHESVNIVVSNILVASDITQAQIYFDYYNLDGAADGIDDQIIVVNAA